MTEKQKAHARNVKNLWKVTAEGLKKAREARKESDYGKNKDKNIVAE